MSRRKFLKGFRIPKRIRKSRPDDRLKQSRSGKVSQQIFAKIPGHEMAEVTEMVYRYRGRRRILDHIFVTWPHIGPNIRRVKMTPFIRIKRKKIKPWYYRAAQAGAGLLVSVIRFFNSLPSGQMIKTETIEDIERLPDPRTTAERTLKQFESCEQT